MSSANDITIGLQTAAIAKLLRYLDSSTLYEIAWDLDSAQTEEANVPANCETIGQLLEQVNARCAEINAIRRKKFAK